MLPSMATTKRSLPLCEDNLASTSETPAGGPASFYNLPPYDGNTCAFLKRHQGLVSDFHAHYTFFAIAYLRLNHISKILDLYFAVDLLWRKFQSTLALCGPAPSPLNLGLTEKAILSQGFMTIWSDAARSKNQLFIIQSI